MKQCLSHALALLLLLCTLLTGSALAWDTSSWKPVPPPQVYGDWYYRIENGGVELYQYNGTPGAVLEIPASVEGYPVVKVTAALPDYNETVQTLIFPDTVQDIGGGFGDSWALTQVKLPAALTALRNSAFRRCYALTTLHIPAKVSSIDPEALYECTGMTAITVDPANPYFTAVDGVLYNKAMTELIYYPHAKAGTEYRVPDTVTKIGGYAFEGCANLERIVLPAGLKTIGMQAFIRCTALREINLPEGLTTVEGWSTFAYCESLESITIPTTLTYVAENMFNDCTSLQTCRLHDGITELRQGAFNGCSSLRSFQLPPKVTAITSGLFMACTSLEDLEIHSGITSIGSRAFMYCFDLTELTIPATVTQIDEHAYGFDRHIIEETLEEGRTILGYAGTEAERYARENGVPFVNLGAAPGNETPPPSITPEPGDAGVVPDPDTGTDPSVPSESAFADVPPTFYCYEPVSWAVYEGITNGTGPSTFSPNQPCSQSEILTFLWRAVFSPEPGAENPYTDPDVSPEQFYYEAALWAWEEGVVDDPALDMSSGCTRSDVVLYLWRREGCPEPDPLADGRDFADVPAGAEYADAVRWAVGRNITTGTDASSFSPDKVCTRGEIVTFLWRTFIEGQ